MYLEILRHKTCEIVPNQFHCQKVTILFIKLALQQHWDFQLYQQIPLRASNEDYSALSPAPLLPREFFNPQIILNSERLIFNATTDSILASAQDSISLSSDNQIGLTSKNVNISGQSIKLGGQLA